MISLPRPQEIARSDFDLYVIGVDGSGLERTTHHGDFPMFSPDGRQVVVPG